MPIRVLSDDVASKIAAGEVIERPGSVVKELVENSLDAGASQITVEVRGGGTGLIKVIDNGCGIPEEDIETAFARHATSKLSSEEDLERIATLGFRGEALPSIAAVSQVEVTSRTGESAAGIFLSMRDGKVFQKKKLGCPAGTVISVSRLFHNVPARLKFLRSASSEVENISNMVNQYALAFPEVRFLLLVEGRTALRSPGSGDLREAAGSVYSKAIAESLLEVSWESQDGQNLRVKGLTSPPEVSRAGRMYSFFVNRRWVKNPMLGKAVEESYSGFLMPGRYSITILNISLDPTQVDINIHPTKREVRFRQDRPVFEATQKAVRHCLTEKAPLPEVRRFSGPPAAAFTIERPLTLERGEGSTKSPALPGFTAQAALPVLRVMGQISNSYIIAEGPEGLYLIDQHAAHERVVYEKIFRQRQEKGVEVQGLLDPLTLEITPRQEIGLKKRWSLLESFGFSLESFGDRTYLLRALPAVLNGEEGKQALLEILEAQEMPGEEWERKIAISMACHSAVRAGLKMSQDEMKELIAQLEKTEQPRTCPHGRPTMIHVSSGQLEREFGRH